MFIIKAHITENLMGKKSTVYVNYHSGILQFPALEEHASRFTNVLDSVVAISHAMSHPNVTSVELEMIATAADIIPSGAYSIKVTTRERHRNAAGDAVPAPRQRRGPRLHAA